MATEASIDSLLKRWGYWLWIGDDPGLAYDRINLLAKLRGQGARITDDWSDAIAVNKAVIYIMQAWPRVGVALKSWYEFRPEMEGIKRKRERMEARRAIFCRRTGQAVTASTFEQTVKRGRLMVQAHIAGQEEAA